MISEQPVAECCSGIKGNIMGLWIHLVKELKLCSQKKKPKPPQNKRRWDPIKCSFSFSLSKSFGRILKFYQTSLWLKA